MSGKRKRNGKKAESLPVATAVSTYGEGEGGAVPEATGVVVTSFDLSSSEAGGVLTTIEGAPVEKEKKTRTRRSSGKILRWTPEEEAKLKEAVEDKGVRGQWQAIAEELGTGRTPAGVDQHWQIMSGRRKRYAQSGQKTRTGGNVVDGDDDEAAVSGGVEVVPACVVDVVTPQTQPPQYSDAAEGGMGDAVASASVVTGAAPVYVTAPVYAAPVIAAPVNTAASDLPAGLPTIYQPVTATAEVSHE